MRTEFLNGVVEACCKEDGVAHGKTAGFSSQSNGLGERCWRMTNGPDADGAEGVWTTRRLPAGRNAALHRHHHRRPHANVARKPFDVFTGKLPSIERLKVFGCRAGYASILSPLCDWKIGDRAQHAVYLGRAADTAAGLFVLDEGSVRASRQSRFHEQEFSWRGGARGEVDKDVYVVGLEEADGGEDAGGPGVSAGGAAGDDAGGPGRAAGNAGAEPEGAGGSGGGAGVERGAALGRSTRPWMPSVGCLDQYAAVAQVGDSPSLDQAASGLTATCVHVAVSYARGACNIREDVCVEEHDAAAEQVGSGLQVGADHQE